MIINIIKRISTYLILCTSLYTYAAALQETAQQESSDIERFNLIASRLSLSTEIAQDLYALRNYDIYVLADDSGSMMNASQGMKTRWDELKDNLQLLCGLMEALDTDGYTLSFLNRDGEENIKHSASLNDIMRERPSGTTPLISKLRTTFQEMDQNTERKKLLLIFTDGQPSDCDYTKGNQDLVETLRERSDDIYISFIMCTNEDSVVEEYNRVIDPIKNIDITDDYDSERRECKKPLSKNEWLAKMLLGPISTKYDQKDRQVKSCCTIM